MTDEIIDSEVCLMEHVVGDIILVEPCIPMLLDELNREGKLKKGDLLAFSAFGAGFTSGACIIEWNK